MASVVMADDGIAFDGLMAETAPLGGAETAFVALAEALAARGHRVEARSRCRAAIVHKGVRWAPLSRDLPGACDLYIGNRCHRVIGLVRRAKRRLFWLHNPASYLKKPRHLWRLAWYRPTLVVTGAYHAATIPRWLPCGGREIIPYGVLDRFRAAPPRDPPPPTAIFTSNPLRGLDWLLDLWIAHIRPAVPTAELHIYAGGAVYGLAGTPRAQQMEEILARAAGLGDPGETFCLALAEAQAMGVPAVVRPLGSTQERVIDGVTGRVAEDDEGFAAAAVRLLRDDGLWRRWHRAALARQRGMSWDAVGARFEALAHCVPR